MSNTEQQIQNTKKPLVQNLEFLSFMIKIEFFSSKILGKH